MSEWQPARVVWVCGKGSPESVQEQIDIAERLILHIRPSTDPCPLCQGRTFTIHPDDANKIADGCVWEMYACEKDVLTD
jgi:hypothetical protein